MAAEALSRGAYDTAVVPAFSAIPWLVHGFEQGTATSVPPEPRAAGRQRVATALAAAGRLFLLKQVHGARVVEAPYDGHPEADAQVAAAPGLLLGIETADCLPVLLVDEEARAVAAVHAGWRGTAAGVVAAAVAALAQGGARPERMRAALGPGIGPCCYEVGDELRAAFGPDGERFFRPGPRGRPHLDVRAANVAQLRSAGLGSDRIHHVADCTYCRTDLYPSYRRNGPGAGRMISVVGIRAGA